MKHITCVIQPFDLSQTIALYEEGICKKQIQCKLKNVEEEILKLSEEYQVYDISLGGNSAYTNKIAESLSVTKYSLNEPLKISFF